MTASQTPSIPWFSVVMICAALLAATTSFGEDPPVSYEIDLESLLPPVIEWDGKSRSLIASEEDPWRTHAENSNFQTTPTYDETFGWIRRLVAASPALQMVSIGRSFEGQDIWMVIASRQGASNPEELQAGDKPVLLAQAGIHSGEVDGKDAGMIILRELAFGRYQELLDHVSFLFIPILNVDGHERISPLSRVNQRGPVESGWRTNARNLNLNRDYSKLDTPEVRALVATINEWDPDLYFDLHVTDGFDQQADVTWSFSGAHAHSPAISGWLNSPFTATLWQDLLDMGHIPGRHVFVIDRRDLGKGVLCWEGGPRYSDGYGGTRHVPTVLVENHSLKPYRQRVLGMTVLLASAMRTLAEQGQALEEAIAKDRARRPSELILGWEPANRPQSDTHHFLAIQSNLINSDISGEERIVWTGEKIDLDVPKFLTTRPLGSVVMPQAYWIPAAWSNIVDILDAHGVEMERIDTPRDVLVEVYRFGEPQYDPEPFEGRFRLTAEATVEERLERYPSGSVRIPTDQPLGILAALLLEPEAPDSFLRWGFFTTIFQRTEYAESYVLEPLALEMIRQNPDLEVEFRQRLESDEEFANSPAQRLEWFYRRSPLFDPQWRLYPVGREMPATD